MNRLRRTVCAALSAVLLCALVLVPAAAETEDRQVTILFTHDLHSHLLPASDGQGGEYGGYARLKTAIDQQKQRNPDAIVVDGGDFSMGSLFQTAYSTAATELRIMGALGYDATTFGNHEYDYRASGLAAMLRAAVDSGDPLPAIVQSNYLPSVNGEEGYNEDAEAVWEAFSAYGVEDYILLERGGIPYVIFGVMGYDSDECAPMSGMVLEDPVETAKAVVEQARAECAQTYGMEPVVICLSHSGTENGKGEDYDLARKVDGIDVIISGHTHTVLEQPIQVNDTWIVSAGEYCKNLGVLNLSYAADGTLTYSDYQLIPIDGTLEEDASISALVEGYKEEVEEDYLSRFGLKFDQVLIHNPYAFDSVDEVYATQHESTLGNLISDAYVWAVEQAEGENYVPVDLALTASGVIRETVPQGQVTVSDVFNISSLGIGADGVPGYPLVSVYLTGVDLKNALEVDASVQPLMSAAQLFCSGVEYSFNTNRMIFNKVTQAALRRPDGTVVPIEDDQLYRVVTGLYCGQMLGAVEEKSFGLLSVVPRDAQGEPIDLNLLEDYIVHDSQGNEVKEWHALAAYLQSMGGEMDESYAQPDGRKTVYSSWNPVELLKNPNRFTIIVCLLAVVLIAVVILVVHKLTHRRMGRTIRRGSGRGYRPYRG